MAIVDALSRALNSPTTGVALGALSGSRVNVAGGKISVPSASSSKTFSLPASKEALAKAVEGARSVLDALTAISGKIDASDGLSSGGVTGSDGRIGLQAEIERLTSRINDTVTESGTDEINLIAAPSTTYRMRSSSLGGSLTVISQPLDSASLGIDSLDVSTQAGTDAAKAAIDAAIRTATERYRVLSEASADLPAPASVTDTLASSLKSLVTGGLLTGATGADSRTSAAGSSAIGRGALVNFQA